MKKIYVLFVCLLLISCISSVDTTEKGVQLKWIQRGSATYVWHTGNLSNITYFEGETVGTSYECAEIELFLHYNYFTYSYEENGQTVTGKKDLQSYDSWRWEEK